MALQVLKKSIQNTIRNNFPPCSVFCRDPLVLVAFDVDFTRGRDWFLDVFRKSRAASIHVFLQLGYEHETQKNAVPFATEVKSILDACPRLKVTVLANTMKEVESLSALGLHAVFCHQNAFLDESRYPLLNVPKRYDAIYIARFTPCKRHQLAADIRSIRLIGDCVYKKEQPYMDEMIGDKLAHAEWSTHVAPSRIPAEIEAARCGLCLSDIEGAMFVSAEYLLCGIPVVNTRNIGGRDELFPDFAVKTVPDDPAAVAEAVQEFVRNPIPPEKIRAAVLEKMVPHRKTFRKLLNEAMAPACFPDSRKIPHKFLIRCTKRPLELLRYGIWHPRPH
jgi:glycosyltransferase involved in cell wall biosynthesis